MSSGPALLKTYKALKQRGLLGKVREVVESVEKADSLAELSNLKKLKGGGNYFRVRVGGYRLGIALDGGTVIFVRLLNRKDIYKYFP